MSTKTFFKIAVLALIAAAATIAIQDAQAAPVSETPAVSTSKETLKALRAEKREACKANPACAQALEIKAEARRAKAATKLRAEIEALRNAK